MDINDIMTLVNSCAFPIVMCILFYVKISALLEKMTDAFNNQAMTINKLIDKLDDLTDKIK